MVLLYDDYKSILTGVERLVEKNGRTYVHRYSSPRKFTSPPAAAGIALDFVSDTDYLKLKLHTVPTNVAYCYVDIYEDGVMIAHDGYTEKTPVEGDVEICAKFKAGSKHIQVYFPTFYESAIEHLELSDGATFAPVDGQKNFVFYGDSITQGYTTPYPGNTYPNIVCRHYNARCLNQASGGAAFASDLIINTSKKADVVFVAYGFNDWGKGQDVEADALGAVERIKAVHPTARIIAITPIFCGYTMNNGKMDCAFYGMPETREKGRKYDFSELVTRLRGVYAKYPDITVIDGLSLIPPETQYLQHDLVHPNEAGFIQYGRNLCKQLDRIL